jgi:hypothetical protein
MKVLVLTLALAGLASTAKLDAQILGRPLPSTNTSINVDGSWRVAGRDGNGNTIYERRTQDRNGNILVQRAVRDNRGNMSIISSNTVYNNNSRNSNCSYNQSTNTVGDIIFGRSGSNVNCTDNGTRVDGGWYQVGQGRDNNSIYERRVRDSNGNLVIQRARRNPNGSFTIISSRGYNSSNDRQWQKAQRQQQKDIRKQQRRDNEQYNQQDNQQYNQSQRDNSDDQGRGKGNNGQGHGRGNNKHNEKN